MNTGKVTLALLLLIWLLTSCLSGAVRPEMQAIANYYEQGSPANCAAALSTAIPLGDEETALVSYYNAILSTEADSAKAKLESIAAHFPKTRYAQLGLLELGKLALLDRNYDVALGWFNKITEPDLDAKHYWIAETWYQKGNFANALASGNTYLRLAPTGSDAEDAHFLLTDAYISLEQYNNAISTLKKLLSKPEIITDEQYLRYRYGYAAEMLDYRPEAISQYKQGLELNRFSQLAFQIEDRLFGMRERYGSIIDLNFLYPYSQGPLPDIVQAELDDKIPNDNQDSTSVTTIVTPVQVNGTPAEGIYLQAGRFSSQNNAVKLCERILKLNLNAQYYQSTQFKDVSWVVIVGPYSAELDAVNAKTTLRENSIDSFIIEN
jgi:tetratricopeptide (TPR) repeat protein